MGAVPIQANFESVINDLNTGALRIGIHAQGFSGGGSEAFVTVGQPPTPVPEPGTLGLLALGLLGAGAACKRFKQNRGALRAQRSPECKWRRNGATF